MKNVASWRVASASCESNRRPYGEWHPPPGTHTGPGDANSQGLGKHKLSALHLANVREQPAVPVRVPISWTTTGSSSSTAAIPAPKPGPKPRPRAHRVAPLLLKQHKLTKGAKKRERYKLYGISIGKIKQKGVEWTPILFDYTFCLTNWKFNLIVEP